MNKLSTVLMCLFFLQFDASFADLIKDQKNEINSYPWINEWQDKFVKSLDSQKKNMLLESLELRLNFLEQSKVYTLKIEKEIGLINLKRSGPKSSLASKELEFLMKSQASKIQDLASKIEEKFNKLSPEIKSALANLDERISKEQLENSLKQRDFTNIKSFAGMAIEITDIGINAFKTCIKNCK